MGSCSSNQTSKINIKITQQLIQEEQSSMKTSNILMFGCDGSGKSTILRQIKCIYNNGFDNHNRKHITGIHKHCVYQMKLTLHQLEIWNMNNENPFLKLSEIGLNAKKFIMDIDETIVIWNDQIVSALKTLWSEESIKEIYKKTLLTNIDYNCVYFFHKLDTLSNPNYVPDDIDVVLYKRNISCVTEETFNVPADLNEFIQKRYYMSDTTEEIFKSYQPNKYHVINIAKQNSTGRKWISCFADFRTVIFVADLACYDCFGADYGETIVNAYVWKYFYDLHIPYELIELIIRFYGKRRVNNKMIETLKLFDYVCNDALKDSDLILFLNKIDLFSSKIQNNISIKVCPAFKSFNGREDSFDKTTKYIRKAFSSLNNMPNRKRIRIHLTNASDNYSIQRAFGDIMFAARVVNLQPQRVDWSDNSMFNYPGYDTNRSYERSYERSIYYDNSMEYNDPFLAADVRSTFV
eukprot:416676_1